MASRPLIGVSAWIEDATWANFRLPAVLVEASLVEKLEAAGADTVLVPPDPEAAPRIAARLDGVVLNGGKDVDPAAYGAEPHPRTDPPQRRRDEGEIGLVRAAIERGLPLLGICRGCQVLNVARGGTLVQDLEEPAVKRHHQLPRHDGPPAAPAFAEHAIRVEAASAWATVVDGSRPILSSHHQALDRLGEGLEAFAWSADGVVEAVGLAGAEFVIGVQWHPEAGTDPALFDALVVAAGGRG